MITVPVTCTINDQNGNPAAGATVTAELNQTEIYLGVIVPEKITATADANGVATLNLWPNELGVNGSMYIINATNPDTGKRFYKKTAISVPNSACNLHDIITSTPYPAIDASQQALAAAQGALALATAQAGIATAKAVLTAADVVTTNADVVLTNADAAQTALDRIATAADRVQTGLDTASASASAGTATTQAGNASTSAGTSTTQAGNAATSAATATTQAGTATTKAAEAASSASTALLAAQSSGSILFYNTKALANSALAGLSDLQVVEVFVDESLGNRRTRYRKESSVFAFKLFLDSDFAVYCDSTAANDSADGLTATTPKKTLAAATAMLKAGSTLNLARGSRWFEQYTSIIANVKIRAYKNGNRPIIDGSLLMSGTWVNDPTYTHLWYLDITFATATLGNFTSGPAGAWHPMLWDEAVTTRPDEAALQRVLNGDTVGGSTVAVTTIAALLTLANANAGSFTVHKTGSTNYEPRSDNGTQFRFYFYPADGTNPNTNGRSVYVVGQTLTALFGGSSSVHELIVQRSGHKDMVNMDYSSDVTLSDFTRCDFLEPGCHATVVGGAEFRNCKAKASRHGDSLRTGGGGFHQYTEVATKGFKICDCEIDGFAHAIYSHGGVGSYTEHETYDVDGLMVSNCADIFYTGSVAKGIRGRRIFARNIDTIAHSFTTSVIFEDSVFINVALYIVVAYVKNMAITLRRCAVYKDPTSSVLQITNPETLGTILSSEYPTVTLENSTIVGAINDPGNANRRQQHWVLTNSIIQQTDFKEPTLWLLGNITTTNSCIITKGATQSMMTAKWPGFSASSLTGHDVQVFKKTIETGDHNFVNSIRTATYSGTPNGDGGADLVMNYNDATWSRWIRIVDAYGAGLHYQGYVTNLGSVGVAVKVYPAPISAFSSKTLANGRTNFEMFGTSMAVTGTLDRDGLKVEVPDGDFFTAGMMIHVGATAGRQAAFGLRKVASVSGNILTLSSACTWQIWEQVMDAWLNQLGVTTDRGTLPTVAITFGFPMYGRVGSGTGINYPKITVTPKIPAGMGTEVSTLPNTTFGRWVGDAGTLAIGMGSSSWNYNADGVTESYGSIEHAKGIVYQAFGVAVGDILKFEAVALIPDQFPQFSSDVLLSGSADLVPGSELSKLGMGYRRQAMT